jgi:carbonic anhydrase/acetyltransferase-like protein (isoleucine patch superfamily)
MVGGGAIGIGKSLSAPIIAFGAESIFTPEMVETARRNGRALAAAIIAGEPEWDFSGLDVKPAERVDPSLLGLEFVVPWVTPGMRFLRVRQAREQQLEKFGTLIDPASVLSSSVRLGEGVYVNAGVTVGAFAELSEGVLLNRNASVGHHSSLGNYVSLGPGATVAARCKIGKGTMVGAGAVLAPGTVIGDNCVLAVGAVVARDMESGTMVAGNPARTVKSSIAGYRDFAVT